MKENYSTENEQEVKDGSIKSKFDYELFDEEKAVVVNRVIQVKRIGAVNRNEKWKIFQDGKVVVIIEAAKLTNKEACFLRTVDGVKLLINIGKSGASSFHAFHKEIKCVMKSKA